MLASLSFLAEAAASSHDRLSVGDVGDFSLSSLALLLPFDLFLSGVCFFFAHHSVHEATFLLHHYLGWNDLGAYNLRLAFCGEFEFIKVGDDAGRKKRAFSSKRAKLFLGWNPRVVAVVVVVVVVVVATCQQNRERIRSKRSRRWEKIGSQVGAET